MNCELTSTICALATAPGGALAVIRVSGPAAFTAVSAICSVRCESVAANTVHYTHIKEGSTVIDEAMVAVFRSPHSYTGEDSVEISCHGSRYIANKILELLVENGCRMAAPGEFTQRAYLNGKMDLSQAEAVADLIASTNEATHHLAMSQLRGGISTELSRLRDHLLKLTSLLELELDFSDHEDLEFADRTELLQLAQTIEAHIAHLAHTFETGNALKQGIPVAIVGAPNVGKSTLLNALLGEERAIVSDIQGTTRDAIEDTINLGGIQFRFIDTAGIRHTSDTIEQMGIERTYQAIDKARIVLWLIDKTPTPEEQQEMADLTSDKTLIIVSNKSDQRVAVANSCVPSVASDQRSSASFFILHSSFLEISAKYGVGLDTLRQQLIAATPTFSDSDVVVTSTRHYEALQRAHSVILRIVDGLESGLSGDLLAEDLRQVLEILGEITGGQILPQETLNNVFSHFCVGK